VAPARCPAVVVEHRIKVADVAVDGPHPQPGCLDRCGNSGNCGGVQLIGNVVAYARQGAQVDFLEAQPAHGGQGRGQLLVPEADG